MIKLTSFVIKLLLNVNKCNHLNYCIDLDATIICSHQSVSVKSVVTHIKVIMCIVLCLKMYRISAQYAS